MWFVLLISVTFVYCDSNLTSLELCTILPTKNNNHENALRVLTLDDFVEYPTIGPHIRPKSKVHDSLPSNIPSEIMTGLQYKSRADEEMDCFGLSSGLQKLTRWMFKPQSKDSINVMFFLKTREHGIHNKWNHTKLTVGNMKSLRSEIDTSKDTILIIHGFMSSSSQPWVQNLEIALLKRGDVNVISVDWAGGSASWRYWKAVGNTRVVGNETAELLKKLQELGLSRKKIHCIGHSLGAHICSYAARKVGVLGRITGLDPAEPCFKGKGLNSSDALYVDVVHTNADVIKRLSGFGKPSLIGTVDFFPNGGRKQPGCKLKDGREFAFWATQIKEEWEDAICSHGRSHELYTASIKHVRCQFWGHSWDMSPHGALKATKKQCSPLACVPMGLSSISFPGRGPFYLPTRSKPPYCMEDQKADKQMLGWKSQTNRFTDKLHKLQAKWDGPKN